MEVTKTKHLLGVEIIKVNNHELREIHKTPEFHENGSNVVPKLVVGGDGLLVFRDDFIEENDINNEVATKYYHLVEFTPIDEWLTIEYYDANYLMDTLLELNFNDLLNEFEITNLVKIKKMNYLVIDVETIESYDYWNGGYEYDSTCSVYGYLNKNLEIIKINLK